MNTGHTLTDDVYELRERRMGKVGNGLTEGKMPGFIRRKCSQKGQRANEKVIGHDIIWQSKEFDDRRMKRKG